MMEAKYYTREDVVINLRDMCWHILRHWRSIVAGAAVCTLLAVGYKYVQDYRLYQNPPTAPTQETAELSEKEKVAVNNVLNHQRALEVQAKHNAYAPMMQIDPSRVSVTVFSAVIQGEKSYAAAQLYSQMLKAGSACGEIAKALNWEEASYVEDLVEIDVLLDSRAEGVDEGVVLQVRAYAPTEEQSRTMASRLLLRLPTLTAAVEKAAGAHRLQTTATEYRVEVNDRFRDIQQGYINDYNVINNNLEDAVDALSAAGKTYIKELQAGTRGSSSGAPTVAPPSVSKKYAVLGFGGGLVLLVALYIFTYLVDKRVKSAEDLSVRYALPVLGELPPTEKAKGCRALDRRLKALLYAQEKSLSVQKQEELLLHQVLLAARKAGVGSLYITGSALSAEECERLTALALSASTEDVTLRVGSCPLYDTDAMDELAAADAALLAEKAEVSTYAAVERELALSKQLDVPVLGAVLLS